MSFDVSAIGGYGAGTNGAVTAPAATINSSARVTGYTTNTITINTSTMITGGYENFTAGTEILVHVSASNGENTYLGKYMVTTITANNNGTLTVTGDFTKILPTASLSKYYVQAITIASFTDLTLNSGTTLQPNAYSAAAYHGGIIAIKCSGTLTFNGGSISLTEKGIPVANKSWRPLLSQETNGNGQQDVNKYSGWENSITADRFLLNAGDGATFIIAKNVAIRNTASRIGSLTTYGVQYCRGASDSVSVPSGYTNIGGSTILIAAEAITGFDVRLISKYRNTGSTAGQGLGRCYIASETKLRNDEGLYAYDCISKPQRLMSSMNIKSFGEGSLGDISNLAAQFNNYAKVTAISADGRKISYTGKTTNGLAQITTNSLVMIHISKNKTNTAIDLLGKFIIAKVLNDNGSILTLDSSMFTVPLASYDVQIVSIAQFNNLTMSNNHSSTQAWNGSTGGILAVAVKNTFNLSNGYLNVENKGGGNAYGTNGLAQIGNAQDSDRLPLGTGHGSVFILANTLTLNTSSRIGATYSGVETGGKGCNGTGNRNPGAGGAGGGYRGSNGTKSSCSDFGQNVGMGGAMNYNPGSRTGIYAKDGAHVLIIANTINNFCLHAISTGGAGGTRLNTTSYMGGNGGAGYGGGGGGANCSGSGHAGSGAGGGGYYRAGDGGNGDAGTRGNAGGCSGFAFVYANNFVSPNTSGLTV